MKHQPALQNSVIVIIGGTTGLGLSGARSCVEAGANVVMVGRSPENVDAATATLGDSTRGLLGDAADPATAGRAISAALDEFGGFHGLYHVAGGSGRGLGDGPVHEITDRGWRETLELNLTSVFNSSRAAIRCFLGRGQGGAILNMTSVLGFSSSPEHFGTHAYATAKAGVIGMTRAMAAYYASADIRINAIAPALVDTPMARRAAQDEAVMKYIKTKQPLDGGRIGTPADLDAAVVFFLSDQSRFATGQILAIDGGWSVTEGRHRKSD